MPDDTNPPATVTPYPPGSPEAAVALTQPPPELREQQQIPASTTLTPPLSSPSAIQGSMDAGQVTNVADRQLPPRPIGASVANQPVSKAEFFRDMLGKFMYSVGEGLANRGTGPTADSRGAGIGMNALHNLDITQQQLEIARKNAEALQAYHGAQAGALQNRFGLVQVPMIGTDGQPVKGSDGNPVMMTLPSEQAARYLQTTGAAGIRATGLETATQTKTDALETIQNLKNSAGQITMTPELVAAYNLPPGLVGEKLTPKSIIQLAPNAKLLQTGEGVFFADPRTGKQVGERLGTATSVANARTAANTKITVEGMRDAVQRQRVYNAAGSPARLMYDKAMQGINQWALQEQKTGYLSYGQDPKEALAAFEAEKQRRVDAANQRLLDATQANAAQGPAQAPKGPAKPNQPAVNPMANVVQQDPALQKAVTALSGIKDKGRLKTQIEGSTALAPGQKFILKKYYGIK